MCERWPWRPKTQLMVLMQANRQATVSLSLDGPYAGKQTGYGNCACVRVCMLPWMVLMQENRLATVSMCVLGWFLCWQIDCLR